MTELNTFQNCLKYLLSVVST